MNLAANFRFSIHFWFLVPISKGEQMPVSPPVDAHAAGPQTFPSRKPGVIWMICCRKVF